MRTKSDHTFHVPVMGLSYTVDSPVKVARFGISSVISIIEDRLIEMMRKHYYPAINKPYTPIPRSEPDYRAKRITDYLNLVNTIVQEQMRKIKTEAFEKGSEIVKYFEMLPSESRVGKLYREMTACTDTAEKESRQAYLRTQVVAGAIDANILTKTDRENLDKQGNVIPDGSDAVAALRGYMNSDLSNSSIVFSAGLNPRLYKYLENFSAFDPDENFEFRKHVIVKVSDYRSAFVQGKFLAKKGIWVSEFRIESGLNCGGHAFPTDGYLLGPILEEFKAKRRELMESIFEIYQPAIRKKLGFNFTEYPEIQITVQGGIGTAEEDSFLHSFYQVSSTGWGTPFLLVPEVTTVEPHTLNLLGAAGEKDVLLSNYSPLGIRFYYLKGTTSDLEKHQRMVDGAIGSPCPEKHLSFNTEFTEEPICTASRQYQNLKMTQLVSLELPDAEFERRRADVLAKECLCVGLSNSASLAHGETFLKHLTAVNICPGPNIVNFSQVVSLRTMTDHIYGRTNIMTNPNRPHMFIAEMKLYINYLREQLQKEKVTPGTQKNRGWYQTYVRNVSDAITYYQNLPVNVISERAVFDRQLLDAASELADIEQVHSLTDVQPAVIEAVAI